MVSVMSDNGRQKLPVCQRTWLHFCMEMDTMFDGWNNILWRRIFTFILCLSLPYYLYSAKSWEKLCWCSNTCITLFMFCCNICSRIFVADPFVLCIFAQLFMLHLIITMLIHRYITEIKILSFWWNFCHLLHWKLSFYITEMKMSFWWNFRHWLHESFHLTTSNAANEENFIKIATFSFQWCYVSCFEPVSNFWIILDDFSCLLNECLHASNCFGLWDIVNWN